MNNNSFIRDIHIGDIISKILEIKRINKKDFGQSIDASIFEIKNILKGKSMDTNLLLKCSKVLRYDFFRLYSSHLMLHHGISNSMSNKKEQNNIDGINIRKNVYTKELILYLISKVRNKEMTTKEVINKFGIPRTTFYKWLQKYPKE
jgi:predicted transcriptional regulator